MHKCEREEQLTGFCTTPLTAKILHNEYSMYTEYCTQNIVHQTIKCSWKQSSTVLNWNSTKYMVQCNNAKFTTHCTATYQCGWE